MDTIADSSSPIAVFEHKKRREWGLGVLAWEAEDRRGYVFENGQTRVLMHPFYSLMTPVKRSAGEVRALLECLKPELEAARAERGSVHTPRSLTSAMSFEEQLLLFRDRFPQGFSDPAWLEDQRGLGAPKRVGAHRDPAIAEARQVLDAAVLESRLAKQEYGEVLADMGALLRRTDLVPSGEIAPLLEVEEGQQRVLVNAVLDFLHGNDPFGPRFDQFLLAYRQVMGAPPGWQLTTTLPALLDPENVVSIRPTAFRAQAKLLARRLAIPTQPSASGYQRCVALAKFTAAKLTERGLQPRDMLDVLDFIRVTTSAAARRRLSELKSAMP